MRIVTNEDVKNATGYQIEQVFNFTADQAQKWLDREQKKIELYIADYAYGGMAQVNYYLGCAGKREIIKQAIIENVAFIIGSNGVDATRIVDKGTAYNTFAISPLAKKILEQNGLLNRSAAAWCNEDC